MKPRRLSARSVAQIIKRLTAGAGLRPESYSAHSLRAGLVTAAARAGKSAHAIMKQTGHKSVSTLHRYIRDAELFDENAAEGVGL